MNETQRGYFGEKPKEREWNASAIFGSFMCMLIIAALPLSLYLVAEKDLQERPNRIEDANTHYAKKFASHINEPRIECIRLCVLTFLNNDESQRQTGIAQAQAQIVNQGDPQNIYSLCEKLYPDSCCTNYNRSKIISCDPNNFREGYWEE